MYTYMHSDINVPHTYNTCICMCLYMCMHISILVLVSLIQLNFVAVVHIFLLLYIMSYNKSMCHLLLYLRNHLSMLHILFFVLDTQLDP